MASSSSSALSPQLLQLLLAALDRLATLFSRAILPITGAAGEAIDDEAGEAGSGVAVREVVAVLAGPVAGLSEGMGDMTRRSCRMDGMGAGAWATMCVRSPAAMAEAASP